MKKHENIGILEKYFKYKRKKNTYEDKPENLTSNFSLLTSKFKNLTSHLPLLTSDHEGITLIALIITIIVMLILVAVTINIVAQGNLFNYAGKGIRETQIGMVKDMVTADIGAKRIENLGEEIRRSELKEILEKYFQEVPDISTMTDEELEGVKLTLKEEYKGYKNIPLIDIYEGILSTNQEFLADEKLKNDINSSSDSKKSPYVKYNNMLWRVLYDVDSGYGVQLIADKSEIESGKIKKVTLGYGDEEADPNDFLFGSSTSETMINFKKAAASYNNAVDRLNKEAQKYIVGGNKDVVEKARSFGCAPDFSGDPNKEPDYTHASPYFQSLINKFKKADDSYRSDYGRIVSLRLELARDADDTWMASRFIDCGDRSNNMIWWFDIRVIRSNDNADFWHKVVYYKGYYTYSSGSPENNYRPVILLKSGVKIINGDGTFDNPYELSL